LPESTRHVRQGSIALRKASSDRSPDSLRIEIENSADNGEGQAVLGIGQKPFPCFMPIASAGYAATADRADLQTIEGILEDGQAQTLQPAVWGRVDDLHGQDNIGGK